MIEMWEFATNTKSRARLVGHFKHSFSVFKQHYIHFYTHFYSPVFQKITNNTIQTFLPNGLKICTDPDPY